MTELARDKLGEAEFFFDKLKDESHPDDFRYYLSAFLSASWSIFDHLGTEWRKYNEFEDWHNDQEERLRDDPFYNFMIRARNGTVHFGGTDTFTNVELKNTDLRRVIISNTADRAEDVELDFDGTGNVEMSLSGASVGTVSLPKSEDGPVFEDLELNTSRYFDEDSVDTDLPQGYSGTPAIEMCESFLEEMNSLIEEAEERFDFIVT